MIHPPFTYIHDDMLGDLLSLVVQWKKNLSYHGYIHIQMLFK